MAKTMSYDFLNPANSKLLNQFYFDLELSGSKCVLLGIEVKKKSLRTVFVLCDKKDMTKRVVVPFENFEAFMDILDDIINKRTGYLDECCISGIRIKNKPNGTWLVYHNCHSDSATTMRPFYFEKILNVFFL